uniref:RING-type domain-containing protein n=1 Tax=Oryza meridionalis TaxID=40149 RepID=A0A0E0F9E3_9ORYZ
MPEMSVGEAREKECGVSLEGFEEGDKLRKMPCEHYFHESCVFKWLQGPSYVPHGVESAYIHINRDIEEDDDAYSDDGFCAVPASSDAIAALPKATMSETETREEEACAVCLEGFKEGDKKPWSRDASDDVPDTSHMSDEQFQQFIDQYWAEQGFNIWSWIRRRQAPRRGQPGGRRRHGRPSHQATGGFSIVDLLDGILQADDDGNGGGATPASSMAIVNLPEMTVGDEKGEAKDCPVCLQGFEEGDKLRMMPCADSHCFHEQCIFSWLLINRHCPLCRFRCLLRRRRKKRWSRQRTRTTTMVKRPSYVCIDCSLMRLIERLQAPTAAAAAALFILAPHLHFQRPNAAAAVPEGYSNGRFGSVPACSEAIAALEETSPGEAKEDCSVCLEAFEEESDKLLRKMPCCHAFHESCIFEWLQVSRLCPLCRFALPTQAEAEAGLWPLPTPGSGSGSDSGT